MFRKELTLLLKRKQIGLAEIARLFDMSAHDVEDDIRHLRKSLKHGQEKLIITPANCRKCGFEFHKDKLHKPGKCPRCHGTWIQEPLLMIKPRS